MRKWLKSFVHNCVVHPMMPFLPVKAADWLHDKNATWAFGLNRFDELNLEGEKKPVHVIRKLAQLLVDDAMDGGPLKKLMPFTSYVTVNQEAVLTGRMLLDLLSDCQKEAGQDSLKDFGSHEEPTL